MMSVPTKSDNPFFIKNNLRTKAKMYIRKFPGLYNGGLTVRLEFDFPSASKEEISLAYLQLMKEGFFFNDCDACVYPPENINETERKLAKFVQHFGLEPIDREIFLALEELGKTKNMGEIARKVISTNSTYDERIVKYNIRKLFHDNFIIALPSNQKPEYLAVNMKLLDGEIV